MFQASFHSIVTYGRLGTRRLIRDTRFASSCDLLTAVKHPADKNLGQYGFALDFKLSREKSRKTEGVFLVGSRGSGGKSKSPPNREFSSRFGKEEMSTEDKRRRLRRLVPSWSFLTRLRRPYLFPCAGKDRGEKGAWGRVWCFLRLNSGERQCFRRRSTR